jgi:hypothetical protein
VPGPKRKESVGSGELSDVYVVVRGIVSALSPKVPLELAGDTSRTTVLSGCRILRGLPNLYLSQVFDSQSLGKNSHTSLKVSSCNISQDCRNGDTRA